MGCEGRVEGGWVDIGALGDVRKQKEIGSVEPLAGRASKVMSELHEAWKEKEGKDM